MVDPMQWWGALTQQFTELATKAMKDGAADAAKTLSGAMAKHSLDAATKGLQQAVDASTRTAAKAAGAAAPKKKKPAAKPSPDA
jgi:hypothetical protein